jgi:hypothetical protein
MPKDVFEFSCPCCGKRVELNVRTGQARAVFVEESRHGKDFDALVSEQRREGERLGSEFDAAREDQMSMEEQLRRKFEEAQKAAKKDKRKRPPHPFMDP